MADCVGVLVTIVLAIQGVFWGASKYGLPDQTTSTDTPTKPTLKPLPRKPNFLLILADDLGYNDIGYTNARVKTPTLDQMARDGVILNNGYMGIACTPSRTSLLTSYYHYRLRLQRVMNDIHPTCVPTDVEMLPEKLRKHGYTNSLLGKWHLGFCQEECLPNNRGFDNFYGFYTGATTYFDHVAGGRGVLGHDWRNNSNTDRTTTGEFSADVITRYAKRLLNEHADNEEPFFMFLSYFNPHTPLEVPPEYEAMYADEPNPLRAKYLGLVSNLDDQVKSVMETLKSTGLYDNTLVIFASDNGGAIGNFSDGHPYRGGKCSMFEGGARNLIFMNSPLLQKTGYTHPGIFHSSDIGATMLSMAGGKMPIDSDGVDQTSMIIHGLPSKRETVVYHIDMEQNRICGQAAYRKGDMKIIWGGYGWLDGRRFEQVEFYRDARVLALVNMTQQVAPGGYEGGYRVSFEPYDFRAIAAINRLWGFNPDDLSSGDVLFYNVTADPSEYRDLSSDPRYARTILEMKQDIINMVETRYNPFTPESFSFNKTGQANPSNFGGEWTTGWCEEMDLTIGARGNIMGLKT